MAHPDMVACTYENADQQSHSSTKQEKSVVSPKQSRQDPLSLPQIGATNVSLVQRSLESQGISSEASSAIRHSWRPGTATQYQTYYEKWESFCHRWNINPLQATLQDGINFLGDLVATGVGYSCINSARSALSLVILLPGNNHIGSHPLFTRFPKGCFEIRPSLPRYKENGTLTLCLS